MFSAFLELPLGWVFTRTSLNSLKSFRRIYFQFIWFKTLLITTSHLLAKIVIPRLPSEITNEPCTSSNYDNTAKKPTTYSKTNYDAETNTSNVKKNRRKQNLEDEADNMQLDKEDAQRIKLNSKYLTVVLK